MAPPAIRRPCGRLELRIYDRATELELAGRNRWRRLPVATIDTARERERQHWRRQ
jgi:hypothetical protein